MEWGPVGKDPCPDFILWKQRPRKCQFLIQSLTVTFSGTVVGPETQVSWLPTLQSFQNTNVQFLLSSVFLFVFPFSKLLEINCSFGDQIFYLRFNSWPMEHSKDKERRKRKKSHSSVPGFSCPENLKSSRHWLPSVLPRPETFSSKVFWLWGL